MSYRDPLPSDPVYDHEPAYLDKLGPERAAFYRQREIEGEYASPRWLNTSSAVLHAELQVALFEHLHADLTRLIDALRLGKL